MAQDRIETLRRFALWRSLPDDVLATIAEAMEVIAWKTGDVIITQGEPGTHFSILTAGRVDVRVRTEGGTVITVATLREGEGFGEMSLLGEEATSADVVAAEDCETLALGRDAFHELLTEHPTLLREFVRLLSRRLKASDVAIGVAKQKEEDLTRFIHEQKAEQYNAMIGSAKPIKDLLKQVDAKATLKTPLLVSGERGSGKELIARMVHQRGHGKGTPFVRVECWQVTESQWGDQLFGLYDQTAAAFARGMSYIALAQGGTLLLKGVQALPPAIQERLVRFLNGESLPTGSRPEVRVIATTRANLLQEAAAGRFSSDLAAILLGDVLEVPPLRDHKRDIPELANHYLKKHAQRLGKNVTGLDDQALIHLVSYDYHYANVRELEEAIERAVIITDNETISEEAIFLGPPPTDKPRGLNLLKLPKPLVRFTLRFFPTGIRVFAGLFFLFILYECFFVPPGPRGNVGTFLVWALWWPALVLSFFFAGRAWCAICPMASAGELGQRFAKRFQKHERRIPAWLKDNDLAIVMGGFFAIVWVEETVGMRHSPFATGLLLLAIISGAIVTSSLFPRRTWCRHLCPMGGFAGLCSTSAMIELRPTPDICSAKCKGHSCYKGDEVIPGCPMFQHVMFVDTNRDCVLCLNCVRLCPNGSPQLNVRIPGRELWSNVSARPQVGMLVVMMLGLLFGQAVVQHWETHAAAWVRPLLENYRFLFVTGVLALCAGLPVILVWSMAKRFGGAEDPVSVTLHWQRVTAWAPLLGAGYTALQIANIPGFEKLNATLGGLAIRGLPEPLLSVMVLPAIQVSIIALGLMFTAATLWKIWPSGEAENGIAWFRGQAFSLTIAALYTITLLSVMVMRVQWMVI